MNRTMGLVAAALMTLGGCNWMQGPQGPDDGEPEPTDLAHQRELWHEAGIVNYHYTEQQDCFCPPEARAPVVVSVREGRVVSVVGADGRADTTRNPGRATVEGLFDLIERAQHSADKVEAQYDPRLGYPTRIFIDWSAQTADEESGYTISNLTR